MTQPGFGEELRYVGRDGLTGMPARVNDRFIAETEKAIERYGRDAQQPVPPPHSGQPQPPGHSSGGQSQAELDSWATRACFIITHLLGRSVVLRGDTPHIGTITECRVVGGRTGRQRALIARDRLP